jgi:hypothetical protein
MELVITHNEFAAESESGCKHIKMYITREVMDILNLIADKMENIDKNHLNTGHFNPD